MYDLQRDNTDAHARRREEDRGENRWVVTAVDPRPQRLGPRKESQHVSFQGRWDYSQPPKMATHHLSRGSTISEEARSGSHV